MQALDGSLYFASANNTFVRFDKHRFVTLPSPGSPGQFFAYGRLVASPTGPVYAQVADIAAYYLVGYMGNSLLGAEGISTSGVPVLAEAVDPSGTIWWDDCEGFLSSLKPSSFPNGASNQVAIHQFSRFMAMTYGPANAFWIYSVSENAIYEVSTVPSEVSKFPYPYAGIVVAIAAGTDGNIWMTTASSSTLSPPGGPIVKMTTSGQFSQYAVSNGGAAVAIAPGPDGRMWFTDSASNKIGAITSNGQITEYPVPTANAGLSAITGAVLGGKKKTLKSLWFTEINANKVGVVEVH